MSWQPIETAPKDVRVLVCGKDFFGDVVVTGAIASTLFEDCWDIVGAGGYECEFEVTPTHWMPCPELPGTEQQNESKGAK